MIDEKKYPGAADALAALREIDVLSGVTAHCVRYMVEARRADYAPETLQRGGLGVASAERDRLTIIVDWTHWSPDGDALPDGAFRRAVYEIDAGSEGALRTVSYHGGWAPLGLPRNVRIQKHIRGGAAALPGDMGDLLLDDYSDMLHTVRLRKRGRGITQWIAPAGWEMVVDGAFVGMALAAMLWLPTDIAIGGAIGGAASGIAMRLAVAAGRMLPRRR